VEDAVGTLQQDSVGAQDDQAIGEPVARLLRDVFLERLAEQRPETEQLTVTIAGQKKTHGPVTQAAVPVVKNQFRRH
jgi:hypothetical protein